MFVFHQAGSLAMADVASILQLAEVNGYLGKVGVDAVEEESEFVGGLPAGLPGRAQAYGCVAREQDEQRDEVVLLKDCSEKHHDGAGR